MRRLVAALLLAAAGACSDPAPPPPPGPASVVEAVSAQDLRVTYDTLLTRTAVVRVRDAGGRPVPGVPVRWAAQQSSVDPAESLTDAIGEARTTWRLRGITAREIPARLEAAVLTTHGTRAVGFTAHVDPGAPVVATVVRFDTLPRRTGLVVEVGQRVRFTTFGRDAFGNGVSDTPAAWSVHDTTRARIEAATGVLTGVAQGVVRVVAAIPGVRPVADARALVVDPLRSREVAAGANWSAPRAAAGAARCWGARFTGPFAPADDVVPPTAVLPGTRLARLTGAGTAACAMEEGAATVWCWRGRETGVGAPTPPVPQRALVGAGDAAAVTALAVGDRSICAADAAGAVRCAPYAVRPTAGGGELDVGAAAPVATLGPVTALAASDSLTCGAVGDGVWCWTTSAAVTRTALARCAVGLAASRLDVSPSRVWAGDAAGAVRCAPRVPAGFAVWVAAPLTAPLRTLAVGAYVLCGVTPDARLRCSGTNAAGLMQRRDFEPVPVEIDAPSPDGSGWSAVAVSDELMPPDQPGLAPHAPHACAVTGAGRTYCWGANVRAQLGVPNEFPCGSRPSVPCSPTPLPVPSASRD
ncbi:Ig-like domain-containing protein [Roseisolibacter sp. H3M3-2]|uniref:Ig-like domain-containing protein n=1 Tax=Roseisolibacter sp. H3M3-2 TaxID=3031323 RepID=UPI0023DC9402|nr:Ig-like domain-containing protein [Roseisolibacter sp. H3M3-2]MDF1503828.1 Ig-like domain-containing protein [Roseisolibacter sp. H3M3-2]